MSVPPTSAKRLFWMRLATAVLASLFTYVLAEIGYRIWHYQRLARQCLEYVVLLKQADDGAVLKMAWQDKTDFNEFTFKFHQMAVFDRDIGYRLRPNMQFECRLPNLSTRQWRTNSHGHISDDEYPVAKPADEFRIITIGDSFTAGENNAVRWQPLLQARLNKNPEWQRFVGGKFTRVINLGMSGIGVGQFQAVFDCEAQQFEPDLTLLNFITRDIARRWYSIGRVETKEDAEEHIRKNILGRLPWMRFYPELIASTALGAKLGLKSKLNAQASRYYDSDEESVRVSTRAIAHIVRSCPAVMLCNQPTLDELEDDRNCDPFLMPVFEAALGETKIWYMRRYLAQLKKDGESFGPWYQFPYDSHPSDLGQEAYAAALEMVLAENVVRRSASP